MKQAKSAKERKHRAGSIPYYIEEVVSYRTEKKTGDGFKDGYPPIVPELLLSLLIEVRTFCRASRFLIGALLFFLIAQLLSQLCGL